MKKGQFDLVDRGEDRVELTIDRQMAADLCNTIEDAVRGGAKIPTSLYKMVEMVNRYFFPDDWFGEKAA